MRRSLTLIAAACLASALLVAPATAGSTGVVSPPKLFAKKLDKVKADSGIDVFLPSHLRVFVKPSKAYPTAVASDGTYDLEIGAARNCGGANACYLANFTGTRGEKPAFRKKVSLAGGHTGYWKGITCGASCSPAEIQWLEGDVLYTAATKGVGLKKEKPTLVKLANEAIKAGPR
jgi:hypothetical protein